MAKSKPPVARRSRRSYLLLTAFSLVLSLAAAEFLIRSFDLFAAERAASHAVDRAEGADGRSADQRFQLHPFLGYAGNPAYSRGLIDDVALARIFPAGPTAYYQRNSRINEHGFPSEYANYLDLKDGFNVGIFGGSVAEQLATIGGETIVNELERRRPELRGRVRILNVAIGGYKQPQQLIALMLLTTRGVKFDAIVNLDGFNEVALSMSEDGAPSAPLFPSRLHYVPMLELGRGTATPDRIERYAAVLEARRRADGWRLADLSWLGHSALARAFAGRTILSLEADATRIEQELQKQAPADPSLHTDGAGCVEQSACWDLIGEVWEMSSLQMAAIADRIGAKYVHALQPNQYDEGSKPLTPIERRIAYDPNGDWPAGVRRGYPMLRARIPGLAARGVRVLDLTQVFKGTTEPIYVDACCHYNQRGTTAIATAIAAALAR